MNKYSRPDNVSVFTENIKIQIHENAVAREYTLEDLKQKAVDLLDYKFKLRILMKYSLNYADSFEFTNPNKIYGNLIGRLTHICDGYDGRLKIIQLLVYEYFYHITSCQRGGTQYKHFEINKRREYFLKKINDCDQFNDTYYNLIRDIVTSDFEADWEVNRLYDKFVKLENTKTIMKQIGYNTDKCKKRCNIAWIVIFLGFVPLSVCILEIYYIGTTTPISVKIYEVVLAILSIVYNVVIQIFNDKYDTETIRKDNCMRMCLIKSALMLPDAKEKIKDVKYKIKYIGDNPPPIERLEL